MVGQGVGAAHLPHPTVANGQLVAQAVEHGPLAVVEQGQVEAQVAGGGDPFAQVGLGGGQGVGGHHPLAHGGRRRLAGQAGQVVGPHPPPLGHHPVDRAVGPGA